MTGMSFAPLDHLIIKKPRMVRAKRFESITYCIGVTLVKPNGSRSNIFYWMSSLHFEKFQGISINMELYQKHTPPPISMTLFLERMGALSATKVHVAPRLPKPILNVLHMHRYIFQVSNFPKQYYEWLNQLINK